ncbi:hypothetical protein AYK24_02610 [Thermoplasmatales archaeon SG8-52-4]|nr:MAG: hypothetical protein AYK24_02610 [Thermoplasmatales archaeon SG8-52-4]
MKYIKFKNLILIIFTVLLLFSSAFVSIGTSINTANDINFLKVSDFNIRSSSVAIKLDSKKIETISLKIDSKDDEILTIESLADLDNIIIANSGYHEYYPSMVSNGRECLVSYEGKIENNTYIYLSNSNDYGQNWTIGKKLTLKETTQGDEIPINSPQICLKPFGREAYGVFLSSLTATGLIGGLEIPDISVLDLQKISYFILNYSKIPGNEPSDYSSFWDFSSPDIVFHDTTNVPWIIGCIGSTNYSDQNDDYSSKDSLMLFYQDTNNPNTVWLQWDHTIENCANLSLAIDDELKKFYGICEQRNNSNNNLLFFKGTYKMQGSNPYLDVLYKNISSNISHKHPKIFVRDDDIYVAAEINIDGITDDILIYHSSNDGVSWNEIDPTGNFTAPPGEFVPKFPLISANSTDIFCAYIEDKNLYLTQSGNLGVNWSDPIQINDNDFSVAEGYRFADMPDGQHIVWTDDRAVNLDIYSISRGVPSLNLMIIPGSLELNATKNPYFSTYNSIKFKVRNTGEDFAENVIVEVIVNRSGLQPYITKYPGFIKYLATGAEIELKQPLFEMTLKGYIHAVSDLSEIDYINVSIIPSSNFQDSDPSDNTESLPATFDDIFPLLSQRPLLVAIFKLLALVI